MADMASLSSQLADRLLPDGLRAFIDTRRAAGESWHAIAYAFSNETGVMTSGQTLRRWADELDAEQDNAA